MIKIKTIPEETIAAITYTGPIDDIDKFSSELLEWLKEREIRVSGPKFVIFYTNPLKKDGRYDVGFPVEGETMGDDRVNVAKIPEHSVVYTFYVDERKKAYNSLIKSIKEKNLDVIGFPREVHHKDQNEIQFPIIK